MKLSKIEFMLSISKLEQAPDSDLPEFAFVWRSNVWKSSLINMLTERKQLAKSSAKPWKTQLINFFNINDDLVLVDLPWYWYAKSSRSSRKSWIHTTYDYLTQRNNLQTVFVLVDSKIPPQKMDIEFMDELVNERIPFDIILTKTDKATQKVVSQNLKLLKQELQKKSIQAPNIFLSSGIKNKWRDKIWEYIETYLK